MKKNYFFILIFVMLTVGYKYDQEGKWDIKRSDPTIWVKFCSSMEDQDFKQSDLPDDDVLEDESIEFDDVINSVINDFNNIGPSFLRLAVYPEDDDNPGDPAAGDSTFTKDRAEDRTISVCIESSDNPFQGGHAISYREEGKRVACTIVLASSTEDKIHSFVQTLTHEIGHCLGLDHDQNTSKSIMSYFLDEGEIRLLPSDEVGIASLYPEDKEDMKEYSNFGMGCTFRD
ncbi:matrixin family metalloprotease [Bacteriovoracaceae bacterium]|nr:matrixin family metalloprotease [Bacteriovoracaceae bacterium]